MWKGYLSHRRTAKAQVSLRIQAVSPEPSLFAHTQMTYLREQEEATVEESYLRPYWVASHARLKDLKPKDATISANANLYYTSDMKWL